MPDVDVSIVACEGGSVSCALCAGVSCDHVTGLM